MATKITIIFVTVCLAALVFGRPEGDTKTAESDVNALVDNLVAKMSSQFEELTKQGMPNLDQLLGDMSKKLTELNAQLTEKGKELSEQIKAKAQEQGWLENKE